MTSRRVFGATPFNVPGEFIGIDFSPDSKRLWAALSMGDYGSSHVVSFDVASGNAVGQHKARGHLRVVHALPGNEVLLGGWGIFHRLSAKGAGGWTMEGGQHSRLAGVSADRSRFVTIEDNVAQVLDVERHTVVHTLKEREGDLYAVAFSADGAWFATGSSKGVVRLFDARTGKEQAKRKSTMVAALAFSPSGGHLLLGHGNGKVELWDLPTLKPVKPFVGRHEFGKGLGPAGCRWVGFSADGTCAYSLGNEGLVRTWSVPDGDEGPTLKVPKRHMQGPVTALSPDGRWLACGSTQGALSVWSTQDRKPLAGEAAPSPILGLALTPDAVVAASNKAFVSWDLGSGARKEVEANFAHTDVKALSSGTLVRLDSSSIYVEESLSEESREAFELVSYASGPFALSRDETRIAAPSQERAQVWGLKRALLQADLVHKERVRACAFGPEDAWLATADDALHLWRLGKTPERIRDIALDGGGQVEGLAVSPRGWIAASVIDIDRDDANSWLLLVDPRSGETLRKLKRPDAVLGQVFFAGDTRVVVADSLGRLLHVDATDPANARWLEPVPEDASPTSLVKEARPLARRGDTVAHVGPDGSVVVETLKDGPLDKGAPFLLDEEKEPKGKKAKNVLAQKPDGLFEKRLEGAWFLFGGRFREATPAFREGLLKELGAAVAARPDAKITHLVLGTGAAASVAEGLKAKGATFTELSERHFMELLLPTTAEALAMLRNEVKDGEARWNSWRKRYMDAHGEQYPVPLQGADLAGLKLGAYLLLVMDFTEALLQGADFTKARLSDTVFRGADLREANFSKARCYRTVFSGANLRGARFEGAELSSNRFDGADLRDVDFSGAKMNYVDFRGADLTGARMPDNAKDSKYDEKTRWPKGYKP
ncbi:WD repeat-containing protein [Corallococcus coralloides DSM 2259]|uniref:WD repeat-containing protein n=1 Tax=Corallococcus coralloides (strain ATCC 25202 / DSM 2259 / NBRC 100086 / M2) TaxID=1144275 RepID=H8MF57_CORCM|nr:pentapeptide repeat-containing protein [Corallococcus coralloides]AFE05046.1 WD repeat-containing protein [Corallococcus coralloides DSM 2259]